MEVLQIVELILILLIWLVVVPGLGAWVAFKKRRKTLGILCIAVIGYGFIFAIVAFFIKPKAPPGPLPEKCPRCMGQYGTAEQTRLDRKTGRRGISLTYVILVVVLGGLVGLMLIAGAIFTWVEGDDGIIQWTYGSTIAGGGLMVFGFSLIGWGVESIMQYRKTDRVPGVKYRCEMCKFQWEHVADSPRVVPNAPVSTAAPQLATAEMVAGASVKRFCPRCGAKMTEGSHTCAACGAQVVDLPAVQAVPKAPTSVQAEAVKAPPAVVKGELRPAPEVKHKDAPAKDAEPRPRKSFPKWAWWVGGGILALMVVAVVILLVASPSQPKAGDTRVRETDGMTEVYVPAGEFLMGASTSDHQANPEEVPQHTVTLDAFWIDQHEITNAQYTLCVEAGACTPPESKRSVVYAYYYGNSQYDEFPALYVNWHQASGYCAWAGGRLPTEAEWEKAARGTEGGMYPWGDERARASLLNYNEPDGDTLASCSFPDGNSPYGACDMAGNVWEWVSDWYADDYYKTSPAENPTGADHGEVRVLKGGSWLYESFFERASMRGYGDPMSGFFDVGFRCARSDEK